MGDVDRHLAHTGDQRLQPIERRVHLARQHIDIVGPPADRDARGELALANRDQGRGDAVDAPLRPHSDEHTGRHHEQQDRDAGPADAGEGQTRDLGVLDIALADQQAVIADLANEQTIAGVVSCHAERRRGHSEPSLAGRHGRDVAGEQRAALVGQRVDPIVVDGSRSMTLYGLDEIDLVVLAVVLADHTEIVGDGLVHALSQLVLDQRVGDEAGDQDSEEERRSENDGDAKGRAAEQLTHAGCSRCSE